MLDDNHGLVTPYPGAQQIRHSRSGAAPAAQDWQALVSFYSLLAIAFFLYSIVAMVGEGAVRVLCSLHCCRSCCCCLCAGMVGTNHMLFFYHKLSVRNVRLWQQWWENEQFMFYAPSISAKAVAAACVQAWRGGHIICYFFQQK